jgi:hypothetical protein
MRPLHWIGTEHGAPFDQAIAIDLRAALPEGGNLLAYLTLRALSPGTGFVRASLAWKESDGVSNASAAAEIDLSGGPSSSKVVPFFKAPLDVGKAQSELVLLIDRDSDGQGGTWTVDLDVP